jgi:hypothetical protein
VASGITVLGASQLLFEFSSADKIDVKQGLIPDAEKSDGKNDKSDGSGQRGRRCPVSLKVSAVPRSAGSFCATNYD